MDEDRQIRFTKLWTEAQPAVADYVQAVVRDSHAAKDIVQNTAIVLLRKFDEWDTNREFLPWAIGFAKFEVLAHRRDAARSRLVLDDTLLDAITETWPSVMTEVNREQSALKDCFETLAPKAREIVRLRYFEEMKLQQVAEQIDSSAGAVRIAMMRIRRQLLECVSRRLRTEGSDA